MNIQEVQCRLSYDRIALLLLENEHSFDKIVPL